MTLPLLHLAGTPYEQGLAHGRALGSQIAHNLDRYFRRFEREVQLSRDDVLLRAVQYLRAIAAQNADYHAALRGVAEGSGVGLDQIAALNVRYELLYDRFGEIAMADGCTSLAVSPAAAADGHLLIGQNWDWIPGIRGAILHTVEPDGLETLGFTEAGIVGAKIGLNSAGLGLAINGLSSADDDWARLTKPFHLRCFEILRCRDLDAAVRVVTETPRTCSANFLIAGVPDRIVDVEAAPDRAYLPPVGGDCLVHANHFVDPGAIDVAETPSEKRPCSCRRSARLRALLRSKRPLSIADVQASLRDHASHPNAICRHEDPADPPDERYQTVASVVMDLQDRVMHVCDGPPCQGRYEAVTLD